MTDEINDPISLQEEYEAEGYEFPEDLKDDFLSLVNLGRLKKEVNLFGHSFYLRTLKSGELLEVSSIVSSIEGDMGRGKAFTLAMVAASLETIDGEPVPGVIFKDRATLQQKYKYLSDTLHIAVVEAIYREYVLLDSRATKVLEALRGKASSKSD